jgi:transposase-like protein
MVFRRLGKNLSWKYVDTEKLNYYLEELTNLTNLGYTFKSFTIDGRKGVVQLLQRYFNTIPIQICHFHQVQIVTRYTTRKTKTECGQELRQLILNLKNLSKNEFTKQFNNLKEKYTLFLKERNDQGQFQHKRLRSVFRSIKTNLPYLFSFQDCPELNIPTTTNSADGSFGQWKYKVRLHRDLSLDRKKQMIDKILSS